MKKIALYGILAVTFCLTQSFTSLHEAKVEKTPDWIIRVDASGVTVIDDGRTCLEIRADIGTIHMSWNNCPAAESTESEKP